MLRTIRPTDIPELFEIRATVEENVTDDGLCEDDVEDALASDCRGWLAEGPDGRAAGFCIANAASHGIWGLFVRPEAQQRGLGSALLDQAVRWLRDEWRGAIWLETTPGTRADAFYARRGWRRDGTTPLGTVIYRLPAQRH